MNDKFNQDNVRRQMVLDQFQNDLTTKPVVVVPTWGPGLLCALGAEEQLNAPNGMFAQASLPGIWFDMPEVNFGFRIERTEAGGATELKITKVPVEINPLKEVDAQIKAQADKPLVFVPTHVMGPMVQGALGRLPVGGKFEPTGMALLPRAWLPMPQVVVANPEPLAFKLTRIPPTEGTSSGVKIERYTLPPQIITPPKDMQQ